MTHKPPTCSTPIASHSHPPPAFRACPGHPQVQAEKEELGGRLHRAEEKRQRYAVQMTKLEVQLADSQNSHAEMEEEKANVFKAVMGEQEARIRELEAQLTDVKRSTSKRSGWPF